MTKIVSIINFLSKEGIESFDSGNEKLNTYFKKYARQNEMLGMSRTFLLVDDFKVIGFYTLSSASLGRSNLPEKEKSKLPNYPIPCIRIGRFAVDTKYQGLGYGKEMMKNIFTKVVSVSNLVGIFGLIVEPKETAVGFYTKFGFANIPDSETYLLAVSTIKKAYK